MESLMPCLKTLFIIFYSTSKHSSAHNLRSRSLRSATLVRYHPTLDHRIMGYSTLSRWIVLGVRESFPATWRSCSAGRSPAWWRLLGPDPLRPSAGTCGGPWGRRWAVLTGWPPAHPAGKRSPASLTSRRSSFVGVKQIENTDWHTVQLIHLHQHVSAPSHITVHTGTFWKRPVFLLLIFPIPPIHRLEKSQWRHELLKKCMS
jgi:hypothetical protein